MINDSDTVMQLDSRSENKVAYGVRRLLFLFLESGDNRNRTYLTHAGREIYSLDSLHNWLYRRNFKQARRESNP